MQEFQSDLQINWIGYSCASHKNYSAYLPDVPGCIAAGKTVEETLSLLREALIMHFDAMEGDGETIPDPDSLVTYFDVETPAERATTVETKRKAVSKLIV